MKTTVFVALLAVALPCPAIAKRRSADLDRAGDLAPAARRTVTATTSSLDHAPATGDGAPGGESPAPGAGAARVASLRPIGRTSRAVPWVYGPTARVRFACVGEETDRFESSAGSAGVGTRPLRPRN